ncbi:MAG: hypothetical protein ACLQU2_20005 [Candidatus Binataceae bacterium]
MHTGVDATVSLSGESPACSNICRRTDRDLKALARLIDRLATGKSRGAAPSQHP